MNIRKYVKSIKDLGANTIAFALGIVIQQLLVMPILARYASEDVFAEIIFFHSVFNVLCVVLGEELGNVKMIRNDVYETKRLQGDYALILMASLAFVVVCSNVCYFLFDISYFNLLVCILTLLLGIVRYYCMTSYRLKQQFNVILIINIFYCVGEIVGLVVAIAFHFYFLVFLIGEIVALTCWMVIRQRNGEKFCKNIFSKTSEMGKTLKAYGGIGGVAIISNGVTYLDRLLVYPLAGASAMNMYYGASSMSKMLSLIVNPFSTFMLAKLVAVRENREEKIIKKCVQIMLPMLLLFIFGSITVTYFGVKIFYPQYFKTAVELLIPIGFATALGLETSLLKPIVMRFYEANKLLFIQMFYALVLIVCMYFFSYRWGMHGFAWATCIGRAIQLFAYFLLLRIRKRGNKNDRDE